MAKTPLFLERQSYRRRRMMDAVRILPLLCAVLWMIVPMMWPNGTEQSEPTSLSHAIGYVFIVWAVGIVATAGLWHRIRSRDDADEARQTEPRS
ncbi:hypothetical protein OS189_02075 [Sulfitobacter sp. F26169L]|uniref:hypothetical protein n=1 Tax=Sulfitobacter sp. F26169L TaxID=2996015 RepID=UPI002260E216|nr:hypothetical protein [Sulfitobacter sp. F26169L]MCX7565129.1 hypothetical protein [Sulfitobacter sp. F26169L]